MIKNKIKILMIGPGETKNSGGGIATYSDILASKLSNEYDVIRIITMDKNTKLSKIFKLIKALFLVLLYIIQDKNIIAHINTAHNNSFMRKALFVRLLRYFKVPVVLHLHSSEFHNFYSNLSKNKQEYVKKIFKMSNSVILLSNSWKEWFITNIGERDNVTVIYNGMDDYLDEKQQLNKKKDIVFIGRLGKRKGTYDLIQAFNNVLNSYKGIKLILAGDGEITECKELVDSLGIKDSVIFLGWINSKQKKELLNTSEIFVLPSYNEGFPLSILEAMSTKMAIISTTVGGIPEEIENKVSGLLIEPGDIKLMTFYLKEILENKDYSERLGNNARKRYKELFTIEKIVNDIKHIYKTLKVANE